MFQLKQTLMALISLDIPNDIHLRVKQMQLALEAQGKKVNLKELYYEIIRKGLDAPETPAK